VAEMVAAQIFNDREGKPQPRIYGAVTIGNQWQFLMLEQKVLRVDNRFYDLEELPSILGILVAMLT
jgi:type IV secretory pathway protease TraF